MAQDQMMMSPAGDMVRCFRRRVANVQSGDWFPEHGAHVVGGPVVDPDDGSQWVALDDGTEVRFTARAKVWLWRRYTAPEWMTDAVDAYRAARDARDAVRESSAPAPTSVAGASGVAWCQLEADDFTAAYPAPRLADFIRDAAAARRDVMA